MTSKTVEIDFNKIGKDIQTKINEYLVWLNNFFKTMDQNEMIAVGVFGIGVILLIIGIILL